MSRALLGGQQGSRFDKLHSLKKKGLSYPQLYERVAPILAYTVTFCCELGLIEQLKAGRLIE